MEPVARSIWLPITLSCLAPHGAPVGVTRLITDGATSGLLSDVFVVAQYRGRASENFLSIRAGPSRVKKFQAIHSLQRRRPRILTVVWLCNVVEPRAMDGAASSGERATTGTLGAGVR